MEQVFTSPWLSLLLKFHIMFNWQLSEQGIRWPVFHDHIAGTGVQPINVTYVFEVDRWPGNSIFFSIWSQAQVFLNYIFLVQFGINLHLWGFQKAQIALALRAPAILALWKTHSCKLIPNWNRNRMITYTNCGKNHIWQCFWKRAGRAQMTRM